MPNEPLSLSPAEACAYTGLSASSLYRAIKAGRIKCRKLGRATLIDGASIREFYASLPEGPGLAVRPQREAPKRRYRRRQLQH